MRRKCFGLVQANFSVTASIILFNDDLVFSNNGLKSNSQGSSECFK